eukprot:597191-Pyramimonas_sp.AAC.1
MIISAYFWTNESWAIRNVSILDAIGDLIVCHGIPWVLQADFNNDIQSLIDTGWIEDVSGVALVPDKPTCAGTGGGRTSDYFIVDSSTFPQSPVQITRRKSMRVKHGWELSRPKPFPLQRAPGCVPEPSAWPEFGARVNGTDDDMYFKCLLFPRLAERELVGICQLDNSSVYCGRGDRPRWICPHWRGHSLTRDREGQLSLDAGVGSPPVPATLCSFPRLRWLRGPGHDA